MVPQRHLLLQIKHPNHTPHNTARLPKKAASLFFRTPTDVKKKASGMPNDAKHHASGLADAVARPRSLVTVGYHIHEPRRGSIVVASTLLTITDPLRGSAYHSPSITKLRSIAPLGLFSLAWCFALSGISDACNMGIFFLKKIGVNGFQMD